MGCHKPDICLKSDQSLQLPAETLQPLPMLLKKCEYVLLTSVVETLKKDRQLKVKGSVSNGKIRIVIEGETIRYVEFENKSSFTLLEDLNKGDKIVFLYQGNETLVDIKAKVVKKAPPPPPVEEE